MFIILRNMVPVDDEYKTIAGPSWSLVSLHADRRISYGDNSTKKGYKSRLHLSSFLRQLVDDEYKTIAGPSWSACTRTEGYHTDTTAR
jgi:hypothetical protein